MDSMSRQLVEPDISANSNKAEPHRAGNLMNNESPQNSSNTTSHAGAVDNTPRPPTDVTSPELQKVRIVLTEREAAELLRVPFKTLRDWRYKGKAEGTYRVVGRRIMYSSQKLLKKLVNIDLK
jgi:hypothetical protein